MPTINEAVQQQFSPAAANYRTSTVHAAGPDLAAIADYVCSLSQPRVLDVGSGAGHVTAAVAPWSSEVVASDLTESMLEQVRELATERGLNNVSTQKADVTQLPFADASFDVVVTRYSAHHWHDPRAGLAECWRVLRPGGTLLVSDIVAPETPALDTFLQVLEYLRDYSHVRDYRLSEWFAMFQELGAQPEKLGSWPVPLEFNPWVARIHTPPENNAMLRQIFASAPAEIAEHFALQPDNHFTLEVALVRAVRS